jgi:hypothetical protein
VVTRRPPFESSAAVALFTGVNLGMTSLFPFALNPDDIMKYCLSFLDLNVEYALLCLKKDLNALSS